MSSRVGARTVAVLTTLMVVALAWAPARAATPPQVFHNQIDVSLTRIEQCGFTVDSVVRGVDTLQVSTDASGNLSFQETSHVVSTMTNEANGKVVTVDGAGRDSWSDAGVLNPDGTTTYTDTLTGRDVRIYTSHSSVLLRDVGYLAIVDTVDSQGNLLDEQLVEHGPHQFAGDFVAYCDAITAAIG